MVDPIRNDPAVLAASQGLLSASCLAPSQLTELRRLRATPPVLTIPADRLPPSKSIAELAADPAMRAFWSDGAPGLPIDLVEPDAPAPQGDRVPCHLFMPEVAWSQPLPPVLRTPRRELYLRSVEPWRPAVDPVDLLDAEAGRALRVAAVGVALWFVGVALWWGFA